MRYAISARPRLASTGSRRSSIASWAFSTTATPRWLHVPSTGSSTANWAHRMVHDGETVVDVPAKLSAQVRVFATGNGRKTDPVDAHSVALAALRAPTLARVQVDPELVVMTMLVDLRDELGRARTQTVNRLHRLLTELFPGGAKKFLSATQARALVAAIKPRDIVGKTRRRLAVELIAELETIDKKTKAADKDLRELVIARGSTLLDLHGIGPSGAARLLADVGDIHRFGNRDRFASWNGTAPLDASSGEQQRHRLSRAGNRRINRTLHIMGVVQLRDPTAGRVHFDGKKAAGKTSMEAMRSFKRCLSNVVHARMLADQKRCEAAGPRGHSGTTDAPRVWCRSRCLSPSPGRLEGLIVA
ncbi:transposase [Amycolatopsis mongoliensis]|uniref:Transposase n=1 Tax=Amycolatopsis mongoliensis TaxID=715475 RepID=A0A9Y2JNT7_9PSEU|nr:transposase [Amycolatopsis sp. 4-36]WIY01955.1 transposase [Amycolatopsis sp. 4-36]